MNESLNQLRIRIEQLENRVGVLQDREDIASLIARYGPAVDSGSPTDTAALWSETGTYSYPFDGTVITLKGREEMHDMVLSDTHQDIIRGGAGHIMTAPAISLDGDRATAICYSILIRIRPGRNEYEVWRLSGNRWELGREPEGWRVIRRHNHLMDSSEASRELLRLHPEINVVSEGVGKGADLD